MSNLSISLIISSIFILTLCQAVVRCSPFSGAISVAEVLLACGLLFCATNILTAWLKTPQSRKQDDQDDDRENG